MPRLNAQELLAINPAVSGRHKPAAILENEPISKNTPKVISTQGRQ